MENKRDIFRRLLSKGNDAYHIAPKFIRWLFWPFRLLHILLKTLRLDLWIIEGKEISSGHSLAIMYAGRTIDKNYFTELAFDNSFKQKYLGRKWLWNVLKAAKDNRFNCSLAIVDVPRKLLKLSEKMGGLYIPSWISGELDTPIDKSMFSKHKNASLRSDLRRIKKNNLNFEVTNEIFQLENFYYNMYEPYIKKIHGDKAMITDYRDIKREFEKRCLYKGLLLITKDNNYIAGTLLNYKDKWAKLSILGIKDGNLNYIQDGAVGATYIFSMQYLEAKGFKKISLGGSRPFLKDGVLQYKRKWNPKITQHTKSGFFAKILKDTQGARGFFLNNPFIYEDVSGFKGAIFVENNKSLCENDFEKFYKNYYHRGISKLIIYLFDTLKNDTDYSIPAALSDKIETFPISRIFYSN